MRVARAFRLPIFAIVTALALSGCMRTSGPVAVAQSPGDLDSVAYGQPYNSPPPVVISDSGGGAIAALRASFAGPRGAYAPV
ncbi:MAG: polysaccharide biosynthesis/export protein, partial [Bradyrhizobium sp.]|nr:polysaccharide biosynthesis/export protein [Bradyrhizobium sp.]